jgi:hexosaminidase
VVDEMALMYEEAGLEMNDFHAGGDEVADGAWTKSPLALELLKEHPEVGDPKNLQAYFFRELVKRLEKRDLRVHGWEEVALLKQEDGTYEPNPEFVDKKVIPYIWNNLWDYDLGYRLANAGYEVVLCNVSNFYFDLAYNKDPLEPGLYWAGFVKTRDSWTFAPFDYYKTTFTTNMGRTIDMETEFADVERLRPEARENILGIEAQLWSETIKGRDMIEYYMLPKLMGFAESAWARERPWETIENQDRREEMMASGWNVFANALGQRELPRLSYMNSGYNYRVPLPGAIIKDGKLLANIEFPGLDIRYTTDGTEPNENAPLYSGAVEVTGAVKLKAFDASGKSSRTVEVSGDKIVRD